MKIIKKALGWLILFHIIVGAFSVQHYGVYRHYDFYSYLECSLIALIFSFVILVVISALVLIDKLIDP